MPELASKEDEAEIHLHELVRAIGADIELLAEQGARARPIGLAVTDTKASMSDSCKSFTPVPTQWASPLLSSAHGPPAAR